MSEQEMLSTGEFASALGRNRSAILYGCRHGRLPLPTTASRGRRLWAKPIVDYLSSNHYGGAHGSWTEDRGRVEAYGDVATRLLESDRIQADDVRELLGVVARTLRDRRLPLKWRATVCSIVDELIDGNVARDRVADLAADLERERAELLGESATR